MNHSVRRSVGGTRLCQTQAHGRSRRSRRAAALKRVARWLVGNAAFAVLGLAVLVTMAAIVVATRTPAQAVGSASDAGSGPHWITLRSQAPGDIIAALRRSPLFNVDRSGNGDHLKDLSRVGTPQFVSELRLTPTSPGADCYVVPILNRAGGTVGVAVAWLNAAHTAIYVGYIRSYDTPLPRWTGALPAADQAVAIVQTQHHAALRADTRPQLIYFPFDFQGRSAGVVHWSAGGEGPDTPVWLVPGADGKDHVVGTDGRAYFLSELPISPLAH